MKKLTLLLSVLMVAFSSVFAQAKLIVTPDSKAFADTSYVKGTVGVELKDTFDFALDTAELAGPLQLNVKGGLDGVMFKAEEVPAADPSDPALVRVSYIATKAGNWTDSVIVSDGALFDTIVVTLKVNENVPVITTSEDAIAWTDITLGEAIADSLQSIDATVDYGLALSVVVSGTDAAKFAAAIKGDKLEVTFTADAPGSYEAIATLSATGAEDKVVTLTASVAKPVITLGATSIPFGEVDFFSEDSVKKSISAEVSGGVALSCTLLGTDKDNFSAKIKEGQLEVAFKGTEARSYMAFVNVTAPGADDKQVQLTAFVVKPIIVAETDAIAWTDIALPDAKAGIKDSINATVNFGELSVVVSGANKDNFTASIANGKLVVEFKAGKPGAYAAVATLKADKAEDKEVALTANVLTPDPALSVKPTSWTETILIANTVAKAEKNISIVGTWLKDTIQAALQGGTPFSWDGDNYLVKFESAETGTFKDTLVVSSEDAQTVKVPLEITVKRPVITAADAALAFGEVELADAMGGKKQLATAVSVDPEEALTVELSGANAAAFQAEIKEGQLVVTLLTNAAGTLAATATLKAADAEDVAIALSATVAMPKPQLSVTPLEWKETIYWAYGKAEAERPISISAIGTFSFPNAEIQGGENSPFKWDSENSKITFYVTAIGLYKDTLVVSAVGAEDKKVALELNVIPGGEQPTTPVITIGTTSLEWGEVELAAAQAGIIKETTATVNQGTLSVAIEGANASAFTAKLENGQLAITFKAAVAGAYAATAVLSATGAESKSIALSATVKESTPPTPAGGWVTDPTDLKAGDKIIITDKAKEMAMSKEQIATEGSAYFRIAKAFDETNISDEIVEVELVASGENFKLKVNGGFLYFDDAWMTAGKNGKKQNWLGTNETGSDFKFVANADGECINIIEVKNDGIILYNYNNGSSPRFSHYAQTSNLATSGATRIYRVGGASPVKPTTTISIAPESASIEVGKTVTLTVTRDGEDELVWATSDASVATVKDGVVTGVKEGTANITATANGKTATSVITVTSGGGSDIPTSTVAAFIAAQGGKCYLTGVVGPIKNTLYGNFDLTDETGTIFVYGLLTADGQAKQFETLGVEEGDTLTVIAEEYKLYNETPEIVNAIFVSVKKKGGDVPPTPEIDLSDIDFAEAIYYVEGTEAFWEIAAYPYTDEDKDTYPFLDFIIGAKDKTHLVGTYDIEEAGIWITEKDSVEYVGGTAVIKVLEAESEEAFAIYSITVTLKDENNKTATFGLEIEVAGFDYATQEAITFEDKPGDVPPTPEIPTKTIAEFIAAQGVKCYLTGVVSNIKNTTFGNFDITDASGSIFVYGLLTADGQAKQFETLGVAEGDTLTIIAETYKLYNETPEIVDAIFVSVKKAGGVVPPTPEGEKLPIDQAYAYYFTYEGQAYWEIQAYPSSESEEDTYPFLDLIIGAYSETHLAGNYDVLDAGLWTTANDSVVFVGGTAQIKCISPETETAFAKYYITATLTNEANETKTYLLEVDVMGWNDDESMMITLEDKAGDQAIENVEFMLDPNAPIYNIMGQRVDRNATGILIQNGQKFMIAR